MLEVKRRDVLELEFTSDAKYDNPFIDVVIDCMFTSPSKRTYNISAFYDGGNTWKIRFSPNEVGCWSYRTLVSLSDLALNSEGQFEVVNPDKPIKGFLKTCPGKYWGFQYESGEPCFIFGDTMYNIFGVAHCGLDIESVLRRRVQQGFNLIRARLQVSPYHPPEGYSDWQTRSTWPWQGSPQKPVFDRFNLDYFKSVDKVVRLGINLGIGFEMIMEAWGFEYPFNQRDVFVPEYEELWMRYLIARYDAFSGVYMWTLMNEYEYYPDGDWHYKPIADLWAIRMGKYVKRIAPHGHPIAVHNGPVQPPFSQRFRMARDVIDLIMFQSWGTTDEKDSWLAAGIEDSIASSMKDWNGSFILAEYGYERNPHLELRFPPHMFMNTEHTRRGAWRGVFCATGVIHGWENTWGPWWIPNEDQDGMKYLLILKDFIKNVEFHKFKPDYDVIEQIEKYERAKKPLCMSTSEKDQHIVYLPVGDSIMLKVSPSEKRECYWLNPRTGKTSKATANVKAKALSFEAPDDKDWVLVLRRFS